MDSVCRARLPFDPFSFRQVPMGGDVRMAEGESVRGTED